MLEFNKLVIRIEVRAIFDVTSAYLLEKETIIHFEDGTQRVFQSANYSVTFETPSEEVGMFLAEKEKEVTK